MKIKSIDKISIFRHYNTIIGISVVHDFAISCFILLRQIKRMNSCVPIISKHIANSSRQLSINKNVHAAATTTRLICASFVA